MTMMRFWAFGAMSLIIAWRQGPLTQALRTSHPWLQIARGVLLIADIWLFVLSLRTLQLPELPYGAFGENFTTEGLREETLFVGDIYSLGDTLLQVSQPRQPCWKPARR